MKQLSFLFLFFSFFCSILTAGGSRPSEDEPLLASQKNITAVSLTQKFVTRPIEATPGVELSAAESVFKALEKYHVGESLYHDEIPKSYAPFIHLDSPATNFFTVKSTYEVKGKNDFLTPVFFNGTSLRLRSDGQFYLEEDIFSYNKHPIFLSVLTPDNHIFTLRRYYQRFFSPPDINNYSLNRQSYVYFFNTHFMYNPDRTRKLSDPFTRADLAYFIGQFKGLSPEADETSNFEDVPAEFWGTSYINFVVNNRIMSEFPDGLFRPQSQVNKTEYIMTLVRTLEFELEKSLTNLPYTDVDGKHWSAKFIRTALREGLILSDSKLFPETLLNVADFIELVIKIEAVHESVRNLLDLSTDIDSISQMPVDMARRLLLQLEEQAIRLEAMRGVRFDSPLSSDVIFGESVIFEGAVFPPEPFDIAGISVTPNPLGAFSAAVPLEEGSNSIIIDVQDQSFDFELFRLSSYDDLSGHWLEATAAKLKYLKITENQPDFYPNEHVSRFEFLLWLSRALEWPLVNVDGFQAPQDIKLSDPYFPVIMMALKENIMSLDEEGNFNSEAPISRAESISVLMRAVDLSQEDIVHTEEFPFWDIENSHWVRPTLVNALSYGIVTPGHNFNPQNMISRAEVAAMFSQIPVLTRRMSRISVK